VLLAVCDLIIQRLQEQSVVMLAQVSECPTVLLAGWWLSCFA
jgi:hypothetical protein